MKDQEQFQVIGYTITRSMIHKGNLPKPDHIFFIVKLRGKKGRTAEVVYMVAKVHEDKATTKGVMEAIKTELESKLRYTNPEPTRKLQIAK